MVMLEVVHVTKRYRKVLAMMISIITIEEWAHRSTAWT